MGGRSSIRERVQSRGQLVNRRKVVKAAMGVAAGGAAGGALLTRSAAPALAAQDASVESGAVAPTVVALADAATIAVDASLGNDFRATIDGNRTVGVPANPTDGQKITLQVTQGAAGSFTLSWSSAFEFSAGLPQPTLSTTAGLTDLLGFIYNASKAKWLLVAFVGGFASPPPQQTGQGVYRLFETTNGPSSPVSYSGPFLCGVVAEVTAGGCWLQGYWWWVCQSGQSTAAQAFALWCMYEPGSGALVPNSAVTSGDLTAGQWNYVPLPTPLPLAPGATYIPTTGFSGNFPITNAQFGAGDPYSGGIVNGPLTAYSDSTGSNSSPFSTDQGLFSVAGKDPTASMPAYGSGSSNFWIDMQISTSPPPGTSYRIWPNYPTIPGHLDSDAEGYTLATEFQLSESCSLDNIWFYSASGAGMLPSRCAIWNVGSQSVVSGTDDTSPSWSGAAGSGWVACSYSGVTLPAGDYKVAVFYGGGSPWYLATTGYWAADGPGGSGVTAGPVTAPGTSAATSPGQSTYNYAAWAYPQTYASSGAGENYWIDVEVTPS